MDKETEHTVANDEGEFDIEKDLERVDLGWRDGADAAEEAFLRYVALRLALEEQIRVAQAQAEAITARLRARIGHLEFRYGPAARAHARQCLEVMNAGRKRPLKSLHTPIGTVGFRRAPDRAVVCDEPKFLEAAARDELLAACVVTRADAAAVGRHVRSTGEVPPGVEVVSSEEKFYVAAAKGVQTKEEGENGVDV